MAFKMSAGFTGVKSWVDVAKADIAAGNTRAMKRVESDMEAALKDQTADILGPKMAKTWKGQVYPLRKDSLTPAAFIYSKAPSIIDAYARGATIVAKAGRRLLAVPTDAVPRKGSGRALTPSEVESRFGRKLRFVPAAGKKSGSRSRGAVAYLILDNAVTSQKSGRARNAGPRAKKPEAIVMFDLVTSVKVPKKIDLQATLNEGAAALPAALAEEWGQ